MDAEALLLRDKYELLHVLGTGGNASVYKAVQRSTKQTVAVKLLAPNGSGGDQRLKRFQREISLCSQLYHPDIVRLLDSGALDNGTHFAVFEFIPGVTLAELLNDQGALKVRRARNLLLQLLQPLAYAHAQGVYHRDLKPSNIMVISDRDRDRVKILDFGISIMRRHDIIDAGRLTMSHEWVGTPSYAAPEQLRGELAEARADIYAWGLILLECLTGLPVVRGRSLPEIIQTHLTAGAHPLPEALQGHRLGGLLAWALEKNPGRRASDAGTLLNLMENITLEDLEDAHGYLRVPAAEIDRKGLWAVSSDTLVDKQRPERVELRSATVVCCKVLGLHNDHTAIEQLDLMLEDHSARTRELLSQRGANICHSFGEYCVSYFGLWRAHDVDAKVALRAALELVERVEGNVSNSDDKVAGFRIAIGIHNGPVTIREHGGARQQLDGVTTGIAMALACLGERELRSSFPLIYVSDSYRALVSRHADFEPAQPMFAESPQAYRFSSASRPSSASDLSGRSTFVGRTQELEALLAAYDLTRSHCARTVIIRGEPGMGKTRLVHEAKLRLADRGARTLEAQCLPEWQNASLRPFARLFAELLGSNGHDSAEANRAIERRASGWGLELAEAVPLFCSWLSLALPDGYAPLPWSSQKQREALHRLIGEAVLRTLADGSILWIEDLHWADPSTLECLGQLVQMAQGRACFIVATTRGKSPESLAALEIVLTRLEHPVACRLAEALLGGAPSEPDAIARLVDRSDGVPLFLEELAMTYEHAAARTGTTSEHSGFDAPVPAVPPSLRDLLTSRLDDVAEAKHIAEFAAVLGREFSVEELSLLTGSDDLSVLADVEQLTDVNILSKREQTGRSMYMFRHTLIRDAAYDNMPARSRRNAHEQIAEGLTEHFAPLCAAQPDVLAQHWELGGRSDHAIEAWKQAALRSTLSSAHAEALVQLDRALALLQHVPDSTDKSLSEAELLLARGATIVGKRGYSDPDALSSFERAAQLLPTTGEATQPAFAARWGQWYFHNAQANLRRAQDLAAELLGLAQAAADSSLSVSAWEAACETSFCVGQLVESVRAGRQCAAEYDFERHHQLCMVRGDDPLLASLSFEAFAELLRGDCDTALVRVNQALALGTKLGYPAMAAAIHAQVAWLWLIYGSSGAQTPDVERAREHAAAARSLAREYGFPFWEVYSNMLDATARIVLGDTSAIAELKSGSDAWRSAGAALGRCWQLTFTAEGLRRAGAHDEALELLDEAITFCVTNESRYFEPEVRRTRAHVLFDRSNAHRDHSAAQEECARALAVAESIGATWWVLATRAMAASFELEIETGVGLVELQRTVDCVQARVQEPPLLREARSMLDASAADSWVEPEIGFAMET